LDNSDMPRIARQIPQGAVVHIISRFVNRAYRLNTDAQRENYLSRAQAASKLLCAQTHYLASADAVSKVLFARLVNPHDLDVGNGILRRQVEKLTPSLRPRAVFCQPGLGVSPEIGRDRVARPGVPEWRDS
ncbi:MAG: hypothetical protein MJE77_04210, partial [Proteobacteria bacterium]|nr:hypothetical protein [Pseudomonadota bacterium]